MTALHVSAAQNNLLLGSLAREDRELLEPHLEPVTLKVRQRLEAANRKIERVCYIDAGLASVVAVGGFERRQAEVAIIGREGMTGVPVTLGIDRSPHDTFMQVEGHGRCISASLLRELMEKSPSLRASLMRYAHALAVQVQHVALANAQGKIEERLSRWLLMAHDRLGNDELHLTHEFLSLMLGVRRAGITTALHQLEKPGLIAISRGCVTILDRYGLEQSANGLYGAPEAEFERLFPKGSD
jgi:CRP-like cAMP-binding protein